MEDTIDRFKFRVYNSIDKVYWDKQALSITADGKLKYDDHGFVLQMRDCDIIEQCTGLKDENGKLIYEGDIVKTAVGATGVVVSCIFKFEVKLFNYEFYDYCDLYGNVEIIGNIHDKEE